MRHFMHQGCHPAHLHKPWALGWHLIHKRVWLGVNVLSAVAPTLKPVSRLPILRALLLSDAPKLGKIATLVVRSKTCASRGTNAGDEIPAIVTPYASVHAFTHTGAVSGIARRGVVYRAGK